MNKIHAVALATVHQELAHLKRIARRVQKESPGSTVELLEPELQTYPNGDLRLVLPYKVINHQNPAMSYGASVTGVL
jgi:hypothetical protein